MRTAEFDRVVLSWPTHLATLSLTDSPTSWMQIARVGDFVSNRYGKFSITKDDLRQMLVNFRTVTPVPPTKLPVDYDHLSMDPKKVGDGIAAGWMAELELRVDENELWARVDWTPEGAERIRKREYQFVSPSFVKDYVWKDGSKIGTTLLAAAITNHPFLEGMSALTLAGGMDEVAIALPRDEPPATASPHAARTDLAEVGQKVTVRPESLHMPGEAGVVFEITEVVGDGSAAFVALTDPQGLLHKWFRVTDLAPALPPPVAPLSPSPAPPAPQGSATRVQGSRRGAEEKSMTTFKLSDVHGNEVEVEQSAIDALELQPKVPAGHVIVPEKDLTDLRAKVVSLSDQVETLAVTASYEVKRNTELQLKAALDKLTVAGFITGGERKWAEGFFASHFDQFGGWATTKTVKIVNLDDERGHGRQPAAEEPKAGERLISLANQIAKEEGISLSKALVRASSEDPEAAEAYHDQFRPQEAR